MRTSGNRLPERYAVCTSEDRKEAVSTPVVKYDCLTRPEECVSESSS